LLRATPDHLSQVAFQRLLIAVARRLDGQSMASDLHQDHFVWIGDRDVAAIDAVAELLVAEDLACARQPGLSVGGGDELEDVPLGQLAHPSRVSRDGIALLRSIKAPVVDPVSDPTHQRPRRLEEVLTRGQADERPLHEWHTIPGQRLKALALDLRAKPGRWRSDHFLGGFPLFFGET
jgi:hypothetical protein